MLAGEAFLLSRTWQVRILTVLTLLAAGLGLLGIYTLHTAPLLIFESASSSAAASDIRGIAGIPLDRAFFLRFPEFFTPTAEAAWWQQQETVYNLLRGKEAVAVELADGASSTVQAQVGVASFDEVIRSTWLIYAVALLYLLSALSVFQRHRSPPGAILTFFLFTSALYFISAAPVIRRSLTLPPSVFRMFISTLYTSAGGMITLVHFALVFPRPRALLARHPWIPSCLYGYFALTSVLYLSGVTAFGATGQSRPLWARQHEAPGRRPRRRPDYYRRDERRRAPPCPLATEKILQLKDTERAKILQLEDRQKRTRHETIAPQKLPIHAIERAFCEIEGRERKTQ